MRADLKSSKPQCFIGSSHISERIIDEQKTYQEVFNHVKQCSYCDPVEIVQAYLKRRVSTPKFHGLVTGTFMVIFSKYMKLMKDRGTPIPRELAAEFYCRLGDLDEVLKYGKKTLELPELVQAAIYSHRSGQYKGFDYEPEDPKMLTIWEFVVKTNMKELPADTTEIENLIAVAEVMLS